MKITTHVDEKLLKDAMKATRARTQRDVIERGLRNVLQESKHRELAKRLGKFRIAWTHDELMRSRA
ncbi:MAG: type II toxin-antitoxin system VapB family antitoxin [Candidatus Coatesbacteria bacterium]